MDKSTLLALTISIVGLVVLQTTQGTTYEKKTIEKLLENCDGKVEIRGQLTNTFHSKKGNYIGIIKEKQSEVPLLIEEEELEIGEELTIKGEASEYREGCFLFPEKVIKIGNEE